MSHFYGTLNGARGEATRCGSKTSGLTTIAASWSGAVRVDLHHDEQTGQDIADVSLIRWHGSGVSRSLYHGPVDAPATDWPTVEALNNGSTDEELIAEQTRQRFVWSERGGAAC